MTVYRQIWGFVGDESGATAIEYGLIATIIAVGLLVALTLTGGGVSTMFEYVSSQAADQFDNIDEL